MRPFDYVEPETLDEALQIAAADPEDTLVMAGGTSLVILMKQDLVRPARVLGLCRIAPLREIGASDGGLQLGALATHGALARSPAVRAHAAALASTFAAVATVRIREQATLGGNLAHADPAQDPPVTLLALDSVAIARSTSWLTNTSSARSTPVWPPASASNTNSTRGTPTRRRFCTCRALTAVPRGATT